jgi:hypothetical protein
MNLPVGVLFLRFYYGHLRMNYPQDNVGPEQKFSLVVISNVITV